jgi:enoyl-[acyl-carrier protein] reductase II
MIMTTLDSLWMKGKDFLGTETPIIAGAMSWISDAPFVAAVSNAGAFGCLAAGNMEPKLLADEIRRTKDLTDKPFAVNLITIAPNYKNNLEAAIRGNAPYIVFGGSFPRKPDIQKAKEAGAKVMAFAPTDALARHLIQSGVDALILEGNEAGGHIGPVSLGILLQQVLMKIDDVPVFVAGGIAGGAFMAHLLLMGAAGVQMGTYFVMTNECGVHPRVKEAFLKAQSRDAVATPQIGSELKVIAVRALRNKGLDKFLELQVDLIEKRKRKEISHEEAQFLVENFWVGGLRRAVKEGDLDTGSLMAGQSVGLVSRVRPMREAIDVLVRDAEAELAKIRHKMNSGLA